MAARKIIKINKDLKLLLFKNSIKLNVNAGVMYFPDINTFKLEEYGVIKTLGEMCLSAYEEGVYQGKKEISDKYKEFENSLVV